MIYIAYMPRILSTTPVTLALQVSTVQYGDISIKLQEGALGDGLGARVWVVAHTLCRYSILMCRLAATCRRAYHTLYATASATLLLPQACYKTRYCQQQQQCFAGALHLPCCVMLENGCMVSTLQALDCTP